MTKEKLKHLFWNKYVIWGLIDILIALAIMAYVWFVVLNLDAWPDFEHQLGQQSEEGVLPPGA